MASVDNKIVEIFIPGPAGRLEAKYFKSKKNTSPIALVLHPHPQYGGTMNNKIVVDIFQTFVDNDFSVCRVNFRGVGKSDGEFDNGQGKKVKLNDPIRGGSKKFYVYVKDGDKVKKVSFGDTTGLSIKRDDPARRKSFRARHNCDNPGPKTKIK